MAITKSKLANDPKYGNIATDLDKLMSEGRKLGATEGPQRIELICEEYKHLSPNTAYIWIDPGSFQSEIEEAQTNTRSLYWVNVLRNILSLAPLIATWAALFTAVEAYQRYIASPNSDKSASFLALWQTGFEKHTWLTFTFAAGLDVVLLVLFLFSILLIHRMERRAYSRAVDYVRRLQSKIDELLRCIATEGITRVGDQSDIDRVVDAVKDVVEKATSAMKQNLDDTTNLLKQYVDTSTNANNTAIQNLQQSVQTALTDMQTSVRQVTDASTQAVTASHQQVESLFNKTVVPMMSSFHQDMGTLHTELSNYQGRLDGLTNASQQLAGASQGMMKASDTLVQNAERYITVGQDIGAQIASLNSTQQEVLSQIQMVASGITTAAGNMNTVTTNMVNATRRIEGVATILDSNVRNTIQAVAQSVDQATRGLAYVGPRLEQTAYHLEQAGQQLAMINVPWFLRRRPVPQNGTRPPQQRGA